MDCTQANWFKRVGIPPSRWSPPGCHRDAGGGQSASRCESPWRCSVCWSAGPGARYRSVSLDLNRTPRQKPQRSALPAAHPGDLYRRCPPSPRYVSPPARCRSPRRSCPRRSRHLLSFRIGLCVRIVIVHIEIHVTTAGGQSFCVIPVGGNARSTGHSRHIEGVWAFVLGATTALGSPAYSSAGATAVR